MSEFKTAQELENYLNEYSLVYYKLVGGLGNQLFGLSRAHLLSKQRGNKIALDISNLDHMQKNLPEWLPWAIQADWLVIITTAKAVSREIEPWNLIKPLEEAPKNCNKFTGWTLSLDEISRSNLFTPKVMPFKSYSKTITDIAIHIRGGDYTSAKGIGLLNSKYYERALEAFSINRSTSIKVYTDDFTLAKAIINSLNLSQSVNYSEQESALATLAELSSAPVLIGSNSTLSWWAAYFSDCKFKCLPKPMYLQDWTAERDIVLSDVIYLNRFKNKISELFNYTLWNYFRA